ncbi:MAG: acetoacetate--CoA ligase [Planctomycetota bacterium]|jgi:acetoacetyl-CoA synthetase|nr:acetoacetate--CoA ligase [Planctomycetota bacterium]
MNEILWQPNSSEVESTQMAVAMRAHGFEDYDSYWKWSVENREEFWKSIWEGSGVLGEMGDTICENPQAMPGAKWFPEAQLSFAENLLRFRGSETAILFVREDGLREEISRDDLISRVAACAAGLRAAGVQQGDRVAGWLPNSPEAVISALATNSLGAVWCSCSPDFGASGVLDRFGQIEPKVLIVCDGYVYKGKGFDIRSKLREVVAALPSLKQTVLLKYLSSESQFENSISFEQLCANGMGAALECRPLPFDHPLYVMFSSGTTGKPKCIVHGQGGTLLQHLKEHRLHCDVREGEKLFYFTTTGWMMWNWLITGLASGATICLWDGNPFHPGPETIWDFASREGIHFLGTSAKWVDACKKAGHEPPQLPQLRAILSTGSPLVPESFDWLTEKVPGAQIASISGGTDLISCFALGNPMLPVRRGELQCRGLGMAVEVWNDHGQSLIEEQGELVCTAPFPSMPTGFWNDGDGAKYHAAYFGHFPNVWRHGDWVQLSENGGLTIFGRSDATLNPGGVRIGTAEIYRQVEQIQAIEEAIVVGRNTSDGDQEVVLFVRLADGESLTQDLQADICKRIREGATPRHVPAEIRAVPDIPRTRSGKISEIAVRNVLHGRPVKNMEALANPEALKHF